MLFVDQQKVFDRVNYKFLKIVLNKMNFDPKLVKLVENLFSNQVAHIVEGNNLSEPFRVERGVRQGDPLSPLLYVLAFEPMLNQLEKKLKGIPMGKQSFKATAYADDLTIGIGSISDWNILKQVFKTYELASNARINKYKTKLVPLTANARQISLPEEEQFKKITEHETLTILGYMIQP